MKKSRLLKILLTAIPFCTILFLSEDSITYSSNPPLARTGAPNEQNCTSCHSGTAVTSGSNYDSLQLKTDMTNDEYIPDSTYNITVYYAESGKSKFGFQTTTLKNSNDTRVGSYTVTNGNTTGRATTSVNGSTREYMRHKSGSGSGKVEWKYQWKAPSRNEGNVTFYVALNSSNSNSSSSGDKIILKEFEFEPSSQLPEATITASSTDICEGDTITLTASGTNNPTSYKWTIPNAKPSSSTQKQVKVVWGQAGTYAVQLEVSNAIGTSLPETLNVRNRGLPNPVVDVSGNTSFCVGDSVTLTARNGKSWKWSNGDTTQSISVKKGGSYSVEVFSAFGCSSISAKTDITVFQQPNLNASPISAPILCQGDTFKILADSGFLNYVVFDQNNFIAQSTSPLLELNLSPGSYSISLAGVDTNGCLSARTNSFPLEIRTRDAGPKPLCDSTTADFILVSWDSLPGVSRYEVSIDSGKTWRPPSEQNRLHKVDSLSFSTLVDVWVRGIIQSPCNYTETGKVLCKTDACFAVSYKLNFEDTACVGDSFHVELSNLNLSHYSIAFDGGDYDTGLSYSFVPAEGTGNIRIQFIDSTALSCPSDDTILTYLAAPYPNPEITTVWRLDGGRNSICRSDAPKDLRGDRTENGFAYLNWEWTGPGVFEPGGGDYEFQPMIAGSGLHYLNYTVTNFYGCTSTITDSVFVHPTQSADFNLQVSGFDVNFTQQLTNVTSWEWDFGDGNTSRAENPNHTYSSTGTYVVTLTSLDTITSCPVASATDSVEILSNSISSREDERLTIYPQPFSSSFALEYDGVLKGNEFVRVYDLMGALIFEAPLRTVSYRIDLGTQESGPYLLHLQTENGPIIRTIVKE